VQLAAETRPIGLGLTRRHRRVSPGVWFVLPAGVLILGLIVYPFGSAVWISLTDLTISVPRVDFVGLRNYGELLSGGDLRRTLLNTFVYAFGSLAVSLAAGMAMAVALNRVRRGRDGLAAVLLLPWIIPTVVSTLVWVWMFNPIAGILNYLLQHLHLIRQPIGWLALPLPAMIGVITVRAWRTIPYFGATVLAALKGVSRDLYEAAMLDGAGPVQAFLSVTLPGIRGVLMLISALTLVDAAYDFAVIFILTRGGPAGATDVLSTMTYRLAFETGRLGAGAAVALTAFPVLAPLIFLTARLLQPQESAT
jgi:ABC-type sugar transport system permease subunit